MDVDGAQEFRDLPQRLAFCTSERLGTWLWGFRAWTKALVGELVDALKFLLDGLSQGKGIGSVSKFFKLCQFERIGLRASGYTLKGRFGFVIAAFELGANVRFADQLHGWQEEVLEDSQFVSVKIIHRLAGRLRVIAQCADSVSGFGSLILKKV